MTVDSRLDMVRTAGEYVFLAGPWKPVIVSVPYVVARSIPLGQIQKYPYVGESSKYPFRWGPLKVPIRWGQLKVPMPLGKVQSTHSSGPGTYHPLLGSTDHVLYLATATVPTTLGNSRLDPDWSFP